LHAAAQRGLEGIVSKKRAAPYVAGSRCDWIKVKTAEWRHANSRRGELFQKSDASTKRTAATQPQPAHLRSKPRDERRTYNMTMLQRFTLKKDNHLGGWALMDQTGNLVRMFGTKAEALAGSKLERLVGKEGGSVRIHKQDGRFEEERTYPRSRDPRASPG
jgi:Uncharacterized protein conserved in bacteria (DUF2188)